MKQLFLFVMVPFRLKGPIKQIQSKRLIATFLAIIILSSNSIAQQQTFNANFQNIVFVNARKIHKVGTNGSAAGNVTLYTNVITIGGQQIDCIVRTVSLTAGAFTLPGSPASGTIPFDYSAATGNGMSANSDNFFSPTFEFNTGGGSCRFRFEFILGGSYNNATNTGTAINLQNVYLNSYDIDGNGNSNSNQYIEFNGFSSYQLGAGSTIGVSYNSTSNLTKFRSNSITNVQTVTDQSTRVRVAYSTVSVVEIAVGADGLGPAYFFLDFSAGSATWNPTLVTSPSLDLNTGSTGSNNDGSTCTSALNISSGATNYTNTAGSVNKITVTFTSASILNGVNERLVINGSTAPSNASISLGFTSSSSSIFSLAGATFKAAWSLASGISTLEFTNNAGGTLTNGQTESLFDAMSYKNNALNPTNGTRVFQFTVQDGSFNSNTASYSVDISCFGTLPVSWLYFNGYASTTSIDLAWSTTQEVNNAFFEVERSTDAMNYRTLDRVMAGQSSANKYSFSDPHPVPGLSFYRLKQVDIDGTFKYSRVINVIFPRSGVVELRTNSSSGIMSINIPATIPGKIQLSLYDMNGRMHQHRSLTRGLNQINISNLMAKGIYAVVIQNEKDILYTGRLVK